MRSLLSLGLALSALAAAPVVAAPATYQLDPTHTDVLFTWNHNGFSFPTGRAAIGTGTLVFDDANPKASHVEVTLPLAQVETHVPKLNDVLKSEKLFDVAKYPEASFRSTAVKATGKGKYEITGDLSLHGVTRPVVLDATLNKIGEHPSRKVPTVGFNATATIKRSEFGIESFLPNIADEVKLHITSEASEATQ
ncbi:YceI family protein [Pseudoxanthomonas sp.]|uniref:YceI family protein n=1 Tax=Pseudoxanthomonas sp. TaxID=1871049 RepID=UPI00262935A4|nr:YceI family protein [Pseudoxanthomonas sp.]WDS37004.1 MAG: YceI family protein [Pseudoxanthomonas sp.]